MTTRSVVPEVVTTGLPKGVAHPDILASVASVASVASIAAAWAKGDLYRASP